MSKLFMELHKNSDQVIQSSRSSSTSVENYYKYSFRVISSKEQLLIYVLKY